MKKIIITEIIAMIPFFIMKKGISLPTSANSTIDLPIQLANDKDFQSWYCNTGTFILI